MHARILGALAVAALLAGAPEARAEEDTFGLGDGADKSQPALSGVVNHVASVVGDVAAGATRVSFGEEAGPGGFGAGDLVMLWQPTGLAAEPPPNQAITSLAAERVGTWEFAMVLAASTNELVLKNPTLRAYTADRAQVVRVPRYGFVTVASGDTVAATPWDGRRGGIVVFLASGTVTVDGAISASGAGFRGGPGWDNNYNDGCTGDFGKLEDGFAQKGEGVFWDLFRPNGLAVSDRMQGRGALANAGGGGNCHNAGGGGGGHATAGGQGGDSYDGFGRAVGGVGGGALDDVLPARLVFGGGGGAGESNGGADTGGGAGGGVVFVRALALAGTGVLAADGSAGAAGSDGTGDGAGGGGAGGTVVVRVAGSAVCAVLSAKGGKGGDSGNFCGAGGGGAGGRVMLQAASVGTCPSDVAAGAAGTGGRAGQAGTAGSNDAAPAGGYCWEGSATCTGAEFCDAALGGCVECLAAADCTASPEEPFCDLASHTCRPCTPADCLLGTYCDEQEGDDHFGRCVACRDSSDCKAPEVCAPDNKCVRCLVDGDCSAPLPVCWAAAQECAECRPSKPTTCKVGAPACSETTWTCGPCTGDHGAATDAPCPTSGLPACILGGCEECREDADCRAVDPVRICDGPTFRCVEGCRGTEDLCPAGERCSSVDSKPGACRIVEPADAGAPDATVSPPSDAAIAPDGAVAQGDAGAGAPADGGELSPVYDLGGCGCGSASSGPAWVGVALALLAAASSKRR